MTKEHHQVDVVDVLTTTKTMCQVVLRIYCCPQFAAVWTLKTEVTIDLFRDRAVPTQSSDR